MDKFKFGLFQHSREIISNSKVDSLIRPNFKLNVQEFMEPVLFIYKFHNDLIKKY